MTLMVMMIKSKVVIKVIKVMMIMMETRLVMKKF